MFQHNIPYLKPPYLHNIEIKKIVFGKILEGGGGGWGAPDVPPSKSAHMPAGNVYCLRAKQDTLIRQNTEAEGYHIHHKQ